MDGSTTSLDVALLAPGDVLSLEKILLVNYSPHSTLTFAEAQFVFLEHLEARFLAFDVYLLDDALFVFEVQFVVVCTFVFDVRPFVVCLFAFDVCLFVVCVFVLNARLFEVCVFVLNARLLAVDAFVLHVRLFVAFVFVVCLKILDVCCLKANSGRSALHSSHHVTHRLHPSSSVFWCLQYCKIHSACSCSGCTCCPPADAVTVKRFHFRLESRQNLVRFCRQILEYRPGHHGHDILLHDHPLPPDCFC